MKPVVSLIIWIPIKLARRRPGFPSRPGVPLIALFPAPGFAAVFGLQDSGSTACDKPEVFIYKVDIIER